MTKGADANPPHAAGPSEGDILIDLMTSHWKSQAVRAVVKLGVLDAPALSTSAAVPVADLARFSEANEEYLYRLLRYLAQFGLFVEEEGRAFKLTSLSTHLRANHPSQLRNVAVSMGDPAHYISWMHLHQAVKEGKPAFALYQPGVSLFDYFGLPENTEEDKAFNKMMNTFTQGVDQASLLHDFSNCRVLADLGGGYGKLVMDIMDKYPNVKQGIVLELPAVVNTLPELSEEYRGKISWVEGDFFKPLSVTADCYVMKSILHDWNDAECEVILRNIAAVMPIGATLVNFDRLMPSGNGLHPAKMMDINMMVMCSGKERTAEQWHNLFGTAGFKIVNIIDKFRNMAAIVAVVAGPRQSAN